MYRNVQLNFADIPLDESEKSHIFRIIENIDETAPSDSGLSFIVGKTDDFVKIHCEVLSSQGVFAAEAIAEKAIDAAQMVEKDIIKKLQDWKLTRFFPRFDSEFSNFQKVI
ncbi:MAG: hypothetical protein VX642_06325 [Bdellovibrionota bacterium]|nr:hypothetical protein [Bdellovibrionota bacterium]